MNTMSAAARLRQLLDRPGLLTMPCCYDALSARLIRRAGFPLTLMSGFAVSATRLGLPDTGLISFAEMVEPLRAICAAEPELLVIGDGDTGYGNALNVRRTVLEYARAGAAAVMIEDQVSPKRCGHTDGKDVIGRREARLKIRAALDARKEAGNEILILARTDARAVHGFDEALARCHDFVEEGADIVFLEAPRSEQEMIAFAGAMPVPTMANLVAGGHTPVPPLSRLAEMGFRIAAYPLAMLSAAVAAAQAELADLAAGRPFTREPQLSFDELKELVGFGEYHRLASRYDSAA